jgi:uncharacterized protein YehS (DUF1456 family)
LGEEFPEVNPFNNVVFKKFRIGFEFDEGEAAAQGNI